MESASLNEMKSFENCFVFIRVFYSFLVYFSEFTIFRDIVEHAGGSRNKVARTTLQICIKKNQRWSRGHKAQGQGQGHKKIRGQGQGQPFRGQNLSRSRTGMLEAKAKDQEHRPKRFPKKKSSSKFFFRRSPIQWRTQNFRYGEA